MPPLLLELHRRQVADRRVDAFDVVNEKRGDVPQGVGEILVSIAGRATVASDFLMKGGRQTAGL